jgi:hypothetical protein
VLAAAAIDADEVAVFNALRTPPKRFTATVVTPSEAPEATALVEAVVCAPAGRPAAADG